MAVSNEELNKSSDGEDVMEPLGFGCALGAFSNADEVISLITDLKNIYNGPASVFNGTYERFQYILQQYLQQPHLLDSRLAELISLLISVLREPSSPMELKHAACKYFRILIEVRGYKVILGYLPHEISDFELVLQFLEAQDPGCGDTWCTSYVLLLWLSIIVKIPFHLSRFDGGQCEGKKCIAARMYKICQDYIVVNGLCRDAAVYLASQLLTRPDFKDAYLEKFFNWAASIVDDASSPAFAKQGALASIAMVLKHGKREELLPYADKLLTWVLSSKCKASPGIIILKLRLKIVQRVGLTYLPLQVAPWRYKRGNRTLAVNLSGGDTESDRRQPVYAPDESDDADVPAQVDDIIDELVQGLRSEMTVRWSAAKGIGRVTGRLPKVFANEVVGTLLELFTPRETDCAWHGACLTLAELGRRGLLLPQRLPDVVPVIVKALMYDEPKGLASVGAQIRDAACYVCWSFARAYDSQELKPYVHDIARALITVAVFDREVNIRRAAAAAFQENVGRQGQFPHGMEIINIVNFYTVGIRANAYLNLSYQVADLPEYTCALIDHLVERKVADWDPSVRELISKVFHKLTSKAPEYMSEHVLDVLFGKSQNIILNTRHGAVLAIGEIMHALHEVSDCGSCLMKYSTLEQIQGLVPALHERLWFKGLGGALMRQACASFIMCCTLAQLPFHNSPVVDEWLSFLHECLACKDSAVRTAAAKALPHLFEEYLQSPRQDCKRNAILDYYLQTVKQPNQVARMGYCLVIGSLPVYMLQGTLDGIIETITWTASITAESLKWAESRRDALKALTQICETVIPSVGITEKNVLAVYEAYLSGLTDYTEDERGDIGAWVREAAMIGLHSLTTLLSKSQPELLSPDLVRKVMSGIAGQAAEKIVNTKALAAELFCGLVHSDPPVPFIPNHGELTGIFPASECDSFNWHCEAITFPKLVRLLAFDAYAHTVLLALILNIGGLTESSMRTASAAFFSYFNTLKNNNNFTEINRLCDNILEIFMKHERVDRVIVPLFKFLEKLMSSGCLKVIQNDDDDESVFLRQVLKLIRAEMSGSATVCKIINGINVVCQFVQASSRVCRTALAQLSIYLCCRDMYVRRATGTCLYEALLLYGDVSNIPAENLESVMAILSETNWQAPVEQLRPIRNKLCELMGIPAPVPLKKN